jgi:hypothetical protein
MVTKVLAEGKGIIARCRLKEAGVQSCKARYREFIEDGLNMGRREDLTGGGLRRSAGGWEGVLEGLGPVFWHIPAFSLAGHQAR